MKKKSRVPFGRRPVLITVLVLLAFFVFYFPSYSRYRELKSESDKLHAQLKVLQEQIQALQHEKQLIQNDKNYLEMVVRQEMGLVKPGEVVYEFEKKPASQTMAPVTPSKKPATD